MRFLGLFLLLISALSTPAQEPVKVNCRFLALEGAPPPPPLLNVAKDGTEIACKIPTNTLSAPVACVAEEGKVSFVTEDGKKPAASAKVPAGWNNVLMIFVGTGKAGGAEPWRVFVIEDSPKNFPEGGAFVSNFHAQDIRFAIGENKHQLKPGGSHGFKQPAKRDDFNMAPVIFQFQKNDKWVTASETMLRFIPGVRYLIFAYVDPASSRPRVSTYQDFKRAPAPQPAQP